MPSWYDEYTLILFDHQAFDDQMARTTDAQTSINTSNAMTSSSRRNVAALTDAASQTTPGNNPDGDTLTGDQAVSNEVYNEQEDISIDKLTLQTPLSASSDQPQQHDLPKTAPPTSPLTFGIEFEFVAAATIKNGNSSFPDPYNPLCFITLELSDFEAGQISNAFSRRKEGNIHCLATETCRVIFNKNRMKFGGPEESIWPDGSSVGWWTSVDSSIQYPGSFRPSTWKLDMPPDGKFFYCGLEVISPVLPAITSGFEEAKKAADILDTQIRSSVNRSCGLHVHVGNGKKGFDLDTLTNVIGILWVFDREIIRLHPRYRKALGGSFYCRSLCSGLLGRWPQSGEIEAKLMEFYTAKTQFELNCMLGHPERYNAYNFTNLSQFTNKQYKHIETIEFRQHEGTLKGDRAMHWAKFCVEIVEWAMRHSKEDMQQFLLDELQSQQNGNGTQIWELAKLLQLEDVANAFEEFVLEKERVREAKKALIKTEHQLNDVMEHWDLPLLFGDYVEEHQSALIELEIKKKAYEDIADANFSKGANRPDLIVKYDSDSESEYGDEIAYYGKVGLKPDSESDEDENDLVKTPPGTPDTRDPGTPSTRGSTTPPNSPIIRLVCDRCQPNQAIPAQTSPVLSWNYSLQENSADWGNLENVGVRVTQSTQPMFRRLISALEEDYDDWDN